jgi:hypothetical protein
MKISHSICSVLLLASTVAATGCATHDRRDTAYDPDLRRGQSLIDQIPNWEGAAAKICCGHLRSCAPGQSPRC